MRAAAAEHHNIITLCPRPLLVLYKIAAVPVFFPIFRREKIKNFRGSEGRTDIRGIVAHGSPIHVAIQKRRGNQLCQGWAAQTRISSASPGAISHPAGTCTGLLPSSNKRAIVNFVKVQRHV